MDRNYFIEVCVGLFLVLAFAAFALLSLNVSGIALSEYNQAGNYKVYANFDNIGGLTGRSKVTMSGVRVGTVSSIGFDSDSQQALVEMTINEEINFLSTDTSAAIQTSGILGEQYIELVSGADEEVLTDGDYITFTQSALILENLIGRFLFQQGQDE